MLPWILRVLLRLALQLFAILVIPVTWIVNSKRQGTCPAPRNPLLFKSATTLAAMIRKRQLKSEELVSAYIDRCRDVNKYLNAIVEPRYELAIENAKAVDRMLATYNGSDDELAKTYPLLGIPISVKESLAVEGMCNDSGTVRATRDPARRDATIVKLAKKAGAIPIAVTNTPQLCMNWETYNNVTGLTLNPYNMKCTVGGGSGGEAALISSGASIIGLGSDMAGSLRLPPMFTGIFGHKPTSRLISSEGHNPDSSDPEFEEYFAVGPLTRFAEDLPLILKVLQEPNTRMVPFDQPIDLNTMKFYYMEGDGSSITTAIGPDVKRAMDMARNHIRRTYNVEVEELRIPNMHHMWEISVRVLLNVRNIRNIYTDMNRSSLIPCSVCFQEIIKKALGFSNNSLTCVAYGPAKKILDKLPSSYNDNLIMMFEEIKRDFQSALSENAVLLYPTFPYPAHEHYRIFYKILNCGYLTMFNALGLPVTACPITFTDSGLPVGIQIVSGKYNDNLTIAVAREFEKAFGGWVPPNTTLETVNKFRNSSEEQSDQPF